MICYKFGFIIAYRQCTLLVCCARSVVALLSLFLVAPHPLPAQLCLAPCPRTISCLAFWESPVKVIRLQDCCLFPLPLAHSGFQGQPFHTSPALPRPVILSRWGCLLFPGKSLTDRIVTCSRRERYVYKPIDFYPFQKDHKLWWNNR